MAIGFFKSPRIWKDRQETWAIWALLLVTLMAYLPVLWADFVAFDDSIYVYENRQVLRGLTADGVLWALKSGEVANWHPLTWISHMIDVSLYGLNAGGHHATSLILHLANTFLLFRVLRRMTGAWGPSWMVAALFALHPLHVESVAWISERKDVLSAFFGLLTLDAFHRYSLSLRPALYLLSLFWFGIGLTAKPMLVTLPFVLLLLDCWPLERIGGSILAGRENTPGGAVWRPVVEKIPFLGLSLVSCIITYHVQRISGAVSGFDALPLSIRLNNALVSYLAYLGKMIWPSGLTAYYPYSSATARTYGLAAGLFLLVFSLAALRSASKRPYMAVGWLWYLGMLVPVIGIVQVGSQAMADRYTYLPLIGVFIAIAFGAQEFRCRHLPEGTLVAAGMAVVIALAGVTVRQIDFWQSPVRLTRRMIDMTQGKNHFAFNLLGTALEKEGCAVEAEAAFREALTLKANYSDALFNLANLLANVGRHHEALDFFNRALAVDANDRQAHNNLGKLLLIMGKTQEAVGHYRQALALGPEESGLRSNLGAALLVAGDFSEALVHLQKAAEDASDVMIQRNLGVGLMYAGRWREAEGCFLKVLSVLPQHAETLRDLEQVQRAMASDLFYSKSQ